MGKWHIKRKMRDNRTKTKDSPCMQLPKFYICSILETKLGMELKFPGTIREEKREL